MNDLRNIGNVNAALATSTFNQYDRLVDEFIHRLFRLAGEEASMALSDVYFNEAGVMEVLDSILDQLPIPDSSISPLVDLSVHYRRLLQSIRTVINEDQVSRQLLQYPYKEDSAIRSERASSSSEEDDTSDDDPLEAAPVNHSDDDLEYTDDEDDITVTQATNAAHDTDKLIDDEAEEMPEGYVSNEGPGEDEETSGSETGTESSGSGDDSESDSTPPPATPGSIEEADEL